MQSELLSFLSNKQLDVTIGHFGTHMWDLAVGDVESKAFLVVSGSNLMEVICLSFCRQDS